MSLCFRCDDVPEQTFKLRQTLGPFCATEFFLFEKPKQFAKQSEFYYATMNWTEREFEGKKYWVAAILALHDAETDHKLCARARSYMDRCKLRWDVHRCDYWSCGTRMPNNEYTDYSGKVIFNEWLRCQLFNMG